jgi:ribonuclease H / adenosylcobalamin/alpha-ribazole phosphatase
VSTVDESTGTAEATKTTKSNELIGWGPDLGTPTTFVLLRHGVTPLTAEKRFSGSGGIDPSLTAEGRDQVGRAAELFADAAELTVLGRHAPFTRIDAVLASPLQRTRETGAIVADRLGLDVTIVDGVRECAFGEWDGLTYGEVRERWPDQLAAWLASPEYAPPGGECFEDVFGRVTRTRAALAEQYRGKTVAVATHVTPIKSFVRDVLGAPSSALFRMELTPASVTVIQWYADGIGSLRTFNSATHLAD